MSWRSLPTLTPSLRLPSSIQNPIGEAPPAHAGAARELQDFFSTLPGDISDILSRVKNGEAKLRLEHRNLDTLARSLDQVSNRISFAIVLAALLIGSAIIVHSRIPPMWYGLPVIGVLGFIISGFMGFSLLWSILKHGKM